jgi:hypothetical protein
LYGCNYLCNKNGGHLQIYSPLLQLSSQQNTCLNANNAVLVRFIAIANLIVKGGDYNCNYTAIFHYVLQRMTAWKQAAICCFNYHLCDG